MAKLDVNIWMPLYIGDLLRETTGMTTEMIGAVVLLYLSIWSKNGPLPDDNEKLARICHMTADRFIEIREDISELFDIDGGKWTNHDLLAERAKWVKYRERKSEAARTAANRRWARQSEDKMDPPGLPDDDFD